MAVGVPHKYMQINTYERSKCYVHLIISQTKTSMEKQFSLVKNQTFVFAQIFPNNFCIHRMDFCFYAEMIPTFAELILTNAEFLFKIRSFQGLIYYVNLYSF